MWHHCACLRSSSEGVTDNGGPYRAVIETSAREAKNLLRLIVPTPNAKNRVGAVQDKDMFNPQETVVENEQHYEFLGKLLAMGVRHSMAMNLNLPRAAWRAYTGRHARLSDLAEIDEELASNLHQLQIIDGHATPQELTSCVERIRWRLGLSELPIEVTPDTKEAFFNYALRKSLQMGQLGLEWFLRGVGRVLPSELFPLFTENELEDLFCGTSFVDVELLKKVTEYEFCNPSQDHITWFWEVLEEFPQEKRREFISFCWARSRLPKSADAFPMPFKIEKPPGQGAIYNKLPKSQTCFFTLALPPYVSKEQLREKLLLAIENSPTMDADFNETQGWN